MALPPVETLNSELIRQWARQLGFDQCGVAPANLGEHATRLRAWLEKGYQGDMAYMSRHGVKREQPDALVPGTLSLISVTMNYYPESCRTTETLQDPEKGYIARYALGRDYHKVLRQRLRQLVQRLASHPEGMGYHYRVFTDSAPVLERGAAQLAGRGWIGKNSMLLRSDRGSLFFIGEIFTDLRMEPDKPFEENHCGTCSRCIDICPTAAIVEPYVVDARRCISYLTIELKGSIPEDMRPLVGNRIFGCDDCQLICPWNKWAVPTAEADFSPRHGLDHPDLCELFSWSREQFDRMTEGMAIRRVGYEGWLRNLAVALGNAPTLPRIIESLEARRHHPSPVVREHVEWALDRQRSRDRAEPESAENLEAIKLQFFD